MPTRFESRLQSSARISGTWAYASTGSAHSFSDTPPGYALTTRSNVWLAGCTCAEYGRTSILPLASAALTRTWSIPLSPSQQPGVRKAAGSAKRSRCTASVGGVVVASAAVRTSRDRSWQWVPGRGSSSDSAIPDPPEPRPPRPRLAAHVVATKASRRRRRVRCCPGSAICCSGTPCWRCWGGNTEQGSTTLNRMSGGPLGRLVDVCRVQTFARGGVVEFHPQLLGPLAQLAQPA